MKSSHWTHKYSGENSVFLHPSTAKRLTIKRINGRYSVTFNDHRSLYRKKDDAVAMARKLMMSHNRRQTGHASSPKLDKSELKKALPPKLAYRFQKWMRKFKYTDTPNQVRPLERSEKIMTKLFKSTMYTDGAIRMDFDANTPNDVKKMALDWAKRKGLKIIESSLNKSTQTKQYVIVAPDGIEISNLIPLKSYEA